MSYNSDLQGNNTQLEEILAAVEELPEAGVGVETCRVVMIDTYYPDEYAVVTYTAFEGGVFVTKQVEYPFVYNEAYGAKVAVLENVVKNTSVELVPVNGDASFTCENAEYWFVAQTMAEDMGWFFYNFRVLGDATITIHP